MAVADVVDVVAVEIHVAPAGKILNPDPFRLGGGVEAWRRYGLVKESGFVPCEQGLGRRLDPSSLPFGTPGGQVRVAFGFWDLAEPGANRLHHQGQPQCSVKRLSGTTAIVHLAAGQAAERGG